ncbi:MAG TPA: tripartite tricarboxylate transporter substrate binding protein, partial [Burkholderiales bacterium]|nr:tripartite tricarboxylate transporter substrate binding protein [Burkholderiales bacterium]
MNVGRLAVLLLGLCAALPVHSQAWPAKPLRLVVNFPPGGAADQIGRALGAKLQESLGQPVVVENRPGANGNIGVVEVAKTPPDGHTLLMSSGGAITTNPHLFAKLAVDPMKELEPVAPAAIVSVFLEIKPSIPAQSLAEFIAHLRANPGKLNYGSPGNGSSPHLAGEMFNKAAKVKTTHVPYKGAGPAMTDLLGGQLDFMFDPGIGLQHVKAGKLRLLAVGSPKRHPAYPDVPTVAEIVGEAFDADTVFGVFVPAGTPKDIVQRLNREISIALQSAELRTRISAIGAQELILTPDAFAARL